ncbi:hypothetical protein FHU38_004987 [Saccharomonospora amisosensis]|uniref:PE family protein n=1 Tax=Saccharomonospora amisosensis TaxID=1128677 RepID=A0A7X5UUN7_9PSEU|nr:hypothetical protein [Saccharomonospora amisosensis]NIJ14586.1 hypothetical protein [Saccharomonospora amisosensis]
MPITWDDAGAGQGAVGAPVGAAAGAVSALDAKAMDKMAAETREMVSSARQGHFRVSEDAAEPIRKTLAEMQTRVQELRADFSYKFTQEPQLGSHAYGQAVAKHQVKTAVEAPGSAFDVLGKLEQVLSDADKALELAMRKYRDNEDSASSTFQPGVV